MRKRRREINLPSEPSRRNKMFALLVVALVIGALIGLRFADRTDDTQPLEAGVLTETEAAAGDDPFDTYSDAVAEGNPVYVLFHSGGCPPCIEAKERASRVLPEYEGRIVYVSAHTVDPRSQLLFELDQFSFRSVPTSFWVNGEGRVVDENVGPLSEDELRSRLDALITQ